MNAVAESDTSTRAGALKFSAHGRSWMIVLRPPIAQPIDRLAVRWLGLSPLTLQYALAARMPFRKAWAEARQVLLLTTIGRRTGRLRTTVLPYFRYEHFLVVCGSKGGGPKDPYWADNLRAESKVWVRVNGRDLAAFAHIAEGAEREEAFPVVAEQHGGLRRYQRQAATHGRDVPLALIALRGPGQ